MNHKNHRLYCREAGVKDYHPVCPIVLHPSVLWYKITYSQLDFSAISKEFPYERQTAMNVHGSLILNLQLVGLGLTSISC